SLTKNKIAGSIPPPAIPVTTTLPSHLLLVHAVVCRIPPRGEHNLFNCSNLQAKRNGRRFNRLASAAFTKIPKSESFFPKKETRLQPRIGRSMPLCQTRNSARRRTEQIKTKRCRP